MKKLFFTLLFLSSLVSFSQDKNKIFQDFKTNYPLYWAGAKVLLGQTKLDPTITEIIDKSLPKIADEDIKGAITEISKVLCEKKNIKELNPQFISYIEPEFSDLIANIKKQNIGQISLILFDIAIVTNNYLTQNILPQAITENPNDAITGKNGQGSYSFSNGDKYVGEFKDGKRNGQGSYSYASGDKYVGGWKDGKKDGQGTYSYANGDKYVGEFKDGKKDGQGTYSYANGDKYVGEFKDGKKDGQGTYSYANGTKYVGGWKDGEKIK